MDRRALKICLAASFFWILVANFNLGFIAIDDYMHGIILYIPAQFSSIAKIIEASQFRSPLPNIFLFSLSSLALKLGLVDPLYQLRFVTTVVALMGSISLIFAVKHFQILPFRKSKELQQMMALLGGFYFLNPLFMTRPLIESLSIPFLTLSSYFLLKAHHRQKVFLSSFYSVLLLSAACVFRYQVGLWALSYVVLFWTSTHKKETLAGLLLGGLVGFVLTGLPDLFMKGQFHSSLKSYLAYNIESSSIYGTTPFYSYLLLLLGLSIPPTFFYKFSDFDFKKYASSLAPLLAGLAAFTLGHSAVPHKEERFMVPILMIFFLLLCPFLLELKEKKNWRFKYFAFLNLLLLLPASLNPPQINTIRLTKYIEQQHADKNLWMVAEGNFLFPMAFSANQDLKVKTKSIAELSAGPLTCNDLIAARYDVRTELLSKITDLREIFVSKPGPLEQLVVYLNPKKNARRGPISVFEKSECAR